MIIPETREFLNELHKGGKYGFYWSDSDKKSIWWPIEKPADIPNSPVNWYFGVHPTGQRGGVGERSKNATVTAINCLFADYDAKDFDGGKSEILNHIIKLPAMPSALVDSGGGYHAYWLLSETFSLASDADRQRAAAIQAAWVLFVGGDPGAKDLARVLRLPGTYNQKYDENPAVKFFSQWLDLDLKHDLGQLEQLSQPELKQPVERQPIAHSDTGDHWLKQARLMASVGTRNDTGLWLACQLRDSGMTQSEADPVMRAYAASVPGDGYKENEALASLKSAYGQPAREPAKSKTPRVKKAAAVDLSKAPEDDEKQRTPDHAELAERWVSKSKLIAYGLGEFRIYDSGFWPSTPEREIKRQIKHIAEAARVEGVRVSANLVRSVTDLASIEISVNDDKWNANQETLVCKNGTLHIPTRELKKHDHLDYATSALSYDYNPKAKAPVFDYVLKSTIPDAADFLQEFAGYSLTIDTSLEVAIWLLGLPGGGKSTVLHGLQTMLGEKAGILSLADIERSRFALENIPGKTLVISTEQPGNYMSSTYILNAFISGEKILVDRKIRTPLEIIPKAKIAWSMNQAPRVSNPGDGIMRRVKVIRFPVIEKSKRDTTLKDKISGEGAGILNWALDGLARLRDRGRFEIPQCVESATEDYQATNDVPLAFVDDCCIIGTDYKIQSSLLYKEYKTWCFDNGHKPQSSTTIAEDWRRIGFERYRSAGKTFWRGVGLLDKETM